MEEHENEGARGVEDGGRAPEGRVISVPAGEGCAFRIERVWLTTDFASHELQQQVEQAREEGLYFAWVREVAAEERAPNPNCPSGHETVGAICPECLTELRVKVMQAALRGMAPKSLADLVMCVEMLERIGRIGIADAPTSQRTAAG